MTYISGFSQMLIGPHQIKSNEDKDVYESSCQSGFHTVQSIKEELRINQICLKLWVMSDDIYKSRRCYRGNILLIQYSNPKIWGSIMMIIQSQLRDHLKRSLNYYRKVTNRLSPDMWIKRYTAQSTYDDHRTTILSSS